MIWTAQKDYAKDSPELAGFTRALEELKAKLPVQVPLIIGAENVSFGI